MMPAVYQKRPKSSLGDWIRQTWFDILILLILGAIGFWLFFTFREPRPTLKEIHFGEILLIAFPIIPALVIAEILLCQAFVRSFWDATNAIMALLYSFIGALFITQLLYMAFLYIKTSIVPAASTYSSYKRVECQLPNHYLNHKTALLCWPDSYNASIGCSLGNTPYSFDNETAVIAFAHSTNLMLIECWYPPKDHPFSFGFPSTCSAVAFSSLVFLFLYLNAKLKTWSNYRPMVWKMVLLLHPIFFAALLMLTEILWERQWLASVLGAIIGTMLAFSAYRMAYGSLFNYRLNHIPLSRAPPYISDAAYRESYQNATLAQKGGWGKDYNPDFPVVWTAKTLPVEPPCTHPQCMRAGWQKPEVQQVKGGQGVVSGASAVGNVDGAGLEESGGAGERCSA